MGGTTQGGVARREPAVARDRFRDWQEAGEPGRARACAKSSCLLWLKRSGRFITGCALGFLPHLLARTFLDNAFHLEEMPVLGVRGLEHFED